MGVAVKGMRGECGSEGLVWQYGDSEGWRKV